MTIARRLTAEFLGTAFLVAAVIGSGIMAERLSAGNVAIALLANTIATGAALVALILTFGPISGAHLNPAVTLSVALEHEISWLDSAQYIAVQILGGITGAIAAHADVRPLSNLSLASRKKRPRPIPKRVHRHLRPPLHNLGMLALATASHPLRRRRLHHRSLLVHLVHILRQSSSNNRQIHQRHIRRHPPHRRPIIRTSATSRRHLRDFSLSLASPQ